MSPDESQTGPSRCCLEIFRCLKKHKEAVNVILVAFGVGIAIVQVLIMREQSDISGQQTKIQEAQAKMERRDRMPYFVATQDAPDADGRQGLRISNEGFPIQYIQHTWLDILQFSVQGQETLVREPIVYYTSVSDLGLGKGPLFKIVAEPRAVAELVRIHNEFQSLLAQRIPGAKGIMESQMLIQLGFRDNRSTELRQEYYSFTPGYGLTQVDEAAWTQKNERHKSAKSLNQFTPDMLTNIVDKLYEKDPKAGAKR